MVPILNHSLFININNKITKLMIEMVIANGLDITILLWLNLIDLTKAVPLFTDLSGFTLP